MAFNPAEYSWEPRDGVPVSYFTVYSTFKHGGREYQEVFHPDIGSRIFDVASNSIGTRTEVPAPSVVVKEEPAPPAPESVTPTEPVVAAVSVQAPTEEVKVVEPVSVVEALPEPKPTVDSVKPVEEPTAQADGKSRGRKGSK